MFSKQILSSEEYYSDSSILSIKNVKSNGENTIWLTDHTNFINYQIFSQMHLHIHKITKWQAFCGKEIKPQFILNNLSKDSNKNTSTAAYKRFSQTIFDQHSKCVTEINIYVYVCVCVCSVISNSFNISMHIKLFSKGLSQLPRG